ncbi:MAG TPA: sigma-70 family RNA polymerase sigma factor [Gemmataceae bacterium]|nr:sigma-70 family RNA polymerase sigma factor [Gemmataceae bacterium]
MDDVTPILSDLARGDAHAAGQLLPLVYDELRRLAAARLAAEPSGHTLQPTALVHEAYLRLVGAPSVSEGWQGRGHFFAAAAEAMRRILVEAARRKKAAKHGGGLRRHDADNLPIAAPPVDDDLVALDEALTRFARVEPQKAELVKLRYFGGLTIEETAAALGISPATAKRHWAYSKAWLLQAMGGGE